MPSNSKGELQTAANNHVAAETISIPWSRISQLGLNQILITPAVTFVSTQWYNVLLPEGLVKDRAGNMNAQVGAGVYCFRTVDTTPPFITVYEPGLGAKGVSMDPTTSFMRLTFNEDVQIGTSLIILSSTGAADIVITTLNMEINGNDKKTIKVTVPWVQMAEKTLYQASHAANTAAESCAL